MDLMTENKVVPKLRFEEFNNSWEKKKLGDVGKVKMCKRIFSNQTTKEGDIPFYKIGTFGKKADAFIDIDLYNEFKHKYSYPKVGEILMSASGTLGRTVVFDGIPSYYQDSNIVWLANNEELITNNFLFYVYQIVRYNSEGGTIQRLYNSIISNTKFYKPSLPEQQKIASFLSTVDEKLQQLNKKKELLEEYKKGVMQKIFSQELRFKDDNGNNYPGWEEKKLEEVLFEHKQKSAGKEEVYSVSVHKGLINQIEHLGRSFSAKNTDHYALVKPNDIVYTKSPTGEFPYGIIKQAKIDKEVIVSPLYAVFTPETKYLGYMLDIHFESKHNVHNYLHSIIQKGAKNTINITNSTFLSKSFKLPIDFDEQRKIGSFLKLIDRKIKLVSTQIQKTKAFKKGLLQQMFV